MEYRLSALLQLHLHSGLNTCLQWIGQRQLQDETRNISVLGFGAIYVRGLTAIPVIATRATSFIAHTHSRTSTLTLEFLHEDLLHKLGFLVFIRPISQLTFIHWKKKTKENKINSLWLNDAMLRRRSLSILWHVMACRLTVANLHLNQCWFILDLTLSNVSISVNVESNSFEENTFEYVVCKMATILFKHHHVKYVFPWWRHQMETFLALLAFCAGNSPVTGEFPAQRPVMRSFDVYLICAWINGWVNNREAGDLRRHRGHHDVTVMPPSINTWLNIIKYGGERTCSLLKDVE